MFKQIVVGVLIALVGGALTYFSHNLVELFGKSNRAEKTLGSTRTMYILMGFIAIIVGFLILFGVVQLQSPMAITDSISSGSL